MTDEGMMKLRVKEIHTLESLRVLKARKITLNFTSKLFDDNIMFIDEVLMRNRVDVKEVNRELRQTEDPDSIIKGCALNIIIDNKLLCIRDDKFRFVPRDDLVEGIRDRAGAQSVRIGYV